MCDPVRLIMKVSWRYSSSVDARPISFGYHRIGRKCGAHVRNAIDLAGPRLPVITNALMMGSSVKTSFGRRLSTTLDR